MDMRKREQHRRIGGSMIEMIFVIPLLAIVIASIFFFGWAGRNRLGMDVASRLVVWAPFHHPNFPSLDRLQIENPRVPPHSRAAPYANVCWMDIINAELFQDRVVEYAEDGAWHGHHTRGGGNHGDDWYDYYWKWPKLWRHGYHIGQWHCGGIYWYGLPYEAHDGRTGQTLSEYAAIVDATTYESGPLATTVLVNTWPRDRVVELWAEFPVPKGPWQNASPYHQGRGYRDGWEWRRGRAYIEDGVAEHFLTETDEAFRTVPDPGGPIGERLRMLYLWHW
jgi:hypothetical protein